MKNVHDCYGWSRRSVSVMLPLLVLYWSVASVTTHAQSQRTDLSRLTQPVLRVAEPARPAPAAQAHPLDATIRMAREKLGYSRQQIRDYSATLVKREQVNGELLDYQFIYVKIRNERQDVQGRITAPFSVYMQFVRPEDLKGREVLWVKGHNNNKLIAHEGSGLVGLLSVWLEPTSSVAMRGQRYPVSFVGTENLLDQYITRMEKSKRLGTPEDFQVQVFEGARVDGRACTCTQLTHPVPRNYLDNYVSRLFIDNEYNIPIRYVTFGWPKRQGDKSSVIEEYTYRDVKLNAGFTDADFNHKNRSYSF